MSQKDYKFQWQDWKKCNCVCRIRIFEGVRDFAGKKIIIASDCNEGNSVTNEAENIATLICRQENIEPSDLVFIEHYGAAGKFDETFDRWSLTAMSVKNYLPIRAGLIGAKKKPKMPSANFYRLSAPKKQEFDLWKNRTLEMKENLW